MKTVLFKVILSFVCHKRQDAPIVSDSIHMMSKKRRDGHLVISAIEKKFELIVKSEKTTVYFDM